MTKKQVRLNLRVDADVPGILRRMAGGRNRMGDYFSDVLRALDLVEDASELFKLGRRQESVEDYVAQLSLRVRYMERQIGHEPSYGDQLGAAMVLDPQGEDSISNAYIWSYQDQKFMRIKTRKDE